MSDQTELFLSIHKSLNLLNTRVAALEMMALALTKSVPDADQFLEEVSKVKRLFNESDGLADFKGPVYEALDRLAIYAKAR